MGHALPIIIHFRGKILLLRHLDVLRRHLVVDDAVPQHVHTLDEDDDVAAEDDDVAAEDDYVPAEHDDVSTQHEKVSTQHVHVPAEDDWMPVEHDWLLAEEKMSCGAVRKLWQESHFALAADGSECYLRA